MSKRNKEEDELDTQTTIVDMNVEGFRWYDPSKKNEDGSKKVNKVSRKDYWKMVRGAFAAYAPYIITFLLSLLGVFLLMYLWLT